MKIVLLTEHLNPMRGGLESWSVRFIRWLCDHGHAVTTVAIDRAPDALPSSVTFHALPAAGSRFERAEAAARLVNTLKSDLVYDFGVGIGADIFHTQFGSRVACEEAEFRSRPAWYRAWKKISPAARKRRRAMADFEAAQYRGRRGIIIAPSRFAAGPLMSRYGVREEEIRVIFNGVDSKRFSSNNLAPFRAGPRRKIGLHDDDILFLQVAVNFQLKGVDTAIRALALLPPHAKYVVVGGGRVNAYRALARRLGVEDRVYFAGQVTDPVPWFAAADACVHTTRHDAGSLSTMEAWAAGLPVITTRQNGMCELMENGREGYLLDDPEDVIGLANLMRALLDAKTRMAMEPHARRLAKNYDIEKQFEAISAACQDLIDNGSATCRLSTPDELRL